MRKYQFWMCVPVEGLGGLFSEKHLTDIFEGTPKEAVEELSRRIRSNWSPFVTYGFDAVEEAMPKRTCCFVYDDGDTCEDFPEYQIWWGSKPDDYTESCSTHLEFMLDDADHDHFTLDRIERPNAKPDNKSMQSFAEWWSDFTSPA